jgi:hypothetical protein
MMASGYRRCIGRIGRARLSTGAARRRDTAGRLAEDIAHDNARLAAGVRRALASAIAAGGKCGARPLGR